MSTEKLFSLKDKLTGVFSSFNEKTILLVDNIVELIDVRIVYALLFLAVAALGISYIWVQNSPVNVVLTPEQISYLRYYETRVQTHFYNFFGILTFAFFLVAGFFAPERFKNGKPSRAFSTVIPDWLKPWVGVIFWAAFFFAYSRTGVNMLQTGLKERDFLLAFATAYLLMEAIKGRFQTRTILTALVLVVGILYVLPIFLPYQVYDTRLFSMDMHWSAVIGDGLYTPPFTESEYAAFTNYGVLLNKLVAASRLVPFFESLGGTAAFLKFTNLLFSGLVIWIVIQRLGLENRRMIFVASLFILFVFSGRISGIATTFDAPNQLPIRIMIVPLLIILSFYLADRKGVVTPIIFGLLSPALLYFNFETGFYCILALGFALFIENIRRGTRSLVIAMAAFAASFLIAGAVLTAVLFDDPIGLTLATLIELADIKIKSGTSGFAGLPVYFFLPLLWVMIHVFVLFARGLLSVKERAPLTAIEFQNLVMIGMIIGVGPYVMNRFSLQNMLVTFLLYVLIMLPKLAKGPKPDRLVWSFILAVLIVPYIFGNPVARAWSKETRVTLADKFTGRLAPCLDGITATDELCTYALEKADELKGLIDTHPGLEWISEIPLNLTRLTGLQPALDQKAAFFFGHSTEKRDILVGKLRDLGAPVLALDNNPEGRGNVAGIHPAAEEFQRDLARKAGYEIVGETKYWLIARQKGE